MTFATTVSQTKSKAFAVELQYILSYLLVTFRTRFRSHFDFLCFISRHSRFPGATQRQLCGSLPTSQLPPTVHRWKITLEKCRWSTDTNDTQRCREMTTLLARTHNSAPKSQIYEHAQWHCYRRCVAFPVIRKKILLDANWIHINIDILCVCALCLGRRPSYRKVHC